MKRSLNDLSVKELEKVLDKWFSLFIRARDSNEDGYVICCTCGRLKKWKGECIGDTDGVDCGHYSKRNKAHRFSETNCNSQCKGCNGDKGGKGEADKHAVFIDKKYGEGTAKELRESENIIIKRQDWWYIEKIEHYKNKFKQL